MERKVGETQQFRENAEKFSDQILSMEGWLRDKMSGNAEAISDTLKSFYGDEFDEEEGGLRELA
jgi:hypothetical protein